MQRALIVAWLVFSFFSCEVNASEIERGEVDADTAALNAAVTAMCSKSIVLLGEATHGDGHSDAVKTRLVTDLIDKCGFNGLLFESSFYEFIPIRVGVNNNLPTKPELVAAAVGGLWKFDTEVIPLFDFLSTRVDSRKIVLGGLDFQAGGFQQPYGNDVMISELTSELPKERATFCNELYHSQLYGGQGPNGLAGTAKISELKACISEARAMQDEGQRANEEMYRDALDNLSAWLSALGKTQRDLIQARDRTMALNVRALHSRLPSPAKIIVWTHNAHAAKTSAPLPEYGGGRNLGAEMKHSFNDQVYSLAITARGGEYRWSRNTNKMIEPPPSDALEARFGTFTHSAFVNSSELKGAGECSAGVFGHSYTQANWTYVFDGVLVLNSEHPPHSTRP